MYEKPLPVIDKWNKPFWDACNEDRLTAQRCAKTGRFWFPPAPVSPYSGTSNWTWEALSGQGIILSWVVMHQKYFKGFAEELPYNIVQIELDEGPVLISNLVGVENDNIARGARVSVVFEKATEGLHLPKFRVI